MRLKGCELVACVRRVEWTVHVAHTPPAEVCLAVLGAAPPAHWPATPR